MADSPLYSEGRHVRRFEGNRRKEGARWRVSYVPEVQRTPFLLLHNNSVRQEWFLPFLTWEVGGTEWILSHQPYSLREGMGSPERLPVTGFTLTSSSAGRSVPCDWNAPSHVLGLCLGLRGRVWSGSRHVRL